MTGRLPIENRDLFVLTALRRANGQQIEAREMLLACLTATDIASLARNTRTPKDSLQIERLAARRRILQVLSGD